MHIDAKENRYIVVSDLPGALLHAEMSNNVHMLLEGTIAKMIAKLDPTIYRKHVWYIKQGKPMLYVQPSISSREKYKLLNFEHFHLGISYSEKPQVK